MSNYNDNRNRTGRDSRMWTWIAGLVGLVVIVGAVFALSDNRAADTASNAGGTASTAEGPATTGAGTTTPGTTR